MPLSPQHRFRPPTPRNAPQARFAGDLDYRDTVFVYPVTMIKNPLGESTEEWSSKPIPIRASLQEQALDTEHDKIHTYGSRFVRLFTRYRNAVLWHDKVVFRGIEMLIVKVTERFDNFDGSFHHTECRAKYLKETDSINEAF